jgi:hypothetical protein
MDRRCCYRWERGADSGSGDGACGACGACGKGCHRQRQARYIDPDETEAVRWMPLGEVPGLIADGAITGAATIIGAQHVLLASDPSLSLD